MCARRAGLALRREVGRACRTLGVIKHGRGKQYEVQEAQADRHEQEHEQEQDKHAQDRRSG